MILRNVLVAEGIVNGKIVRASLLLEQLFVEQIFLPLTAPKRLFVSLLRGDDFDLRVELLGELQASRKFVGTGVGTGRTVTC